MTPERERLKIAIEARAVELGLTLSEVAKRAGMSPANLLRIRNGEIALTPLAVAAIERALEWERGSVQAILDGAEPTVRRPSLRPTAERADTESETTAENLPLAVQIALEFGRLLDYDVYTTEVDGESMQMIQIAVTNAQAVDALKKQLERFGEIKGYVRRHVEGDLDTTGAEGDSADE